MTDPLRDGLGCPQLGTEVSLKLQYLPSHSIAALLLHVSVNCCLPFNHLDSPLQCQFIIAGVVAGSVYMFCMLKSCQE